MIIFGKHNVMYFNPDLWIANICGIISISIFRDNEFLWASIVENDSHGTTNRR